jgi:ACT domain-containing protein
MYEFSKKVLLKVSFDKVLFRKELLKAKKWLKRDEYVLLQAWCLSNFGHIYRDTIMDVYEMA